VWHLCVQMNLLPSSALRVTWSFDIWSYDMKEWLLNVSTNFVKFLIEAEEPVAIILFENAL